MELVGHALDYFADLLGYAVVVELPFGVDDSESEQL